MKLLTLSRYTSRGLHEHHLWLVIVMCSAAEPAVDAVLLTGERLRANIAHYTLLARARAQ